MNNERIKYFDLLKGIAIFLVVAGHILTISIREIDSAFIFKLIQEVHMPVFFFISGYLAFKSGFQVPALVKRFRQLIIPFVVVSAIWMLYFPHSGLQSPFPDTIEGLYKSAGKNGYWFTLCLFELFVAYYFLCLVFRRVRNFPVQMAITLLFYIVLILMQSIFVSAECDYAGLELLTMFFPVFMFGVFSHKHSEVFKRISTGNNVWFAASVAIFAVTCYYASYYWEFTQLPRSIRYVLTPVEHLSWIIIAISVVRPWSDVEFAVKSSPSVVARYFNYLGRESLGIYLLHYFFLFPLTALQAPLKEQGLSFVPLATISFVCAFAVIAFALLANYMICRNKILSQIIVGKI